MQTTVYDTFKGTYDATLKEFQAVKHGGVEEEGEKKRLPQLFGSAVERHVLLYRRMRYAMSQVLGRAHDDDDRSAASIDSFMKYAQAKTKAMLSSSSSSFRPPAEIMRGFPDDWRIQFDQIMANTERVDVEFFQAVQNMARKYPVPVPEPKTEAGAEGAEAAEEKEAEETKEAPKMMSVAPAETKKSAAEMIAEMAKAAEGKKAKKTTTTTTTTAAKQKQPKKASGSKKGGKSSKSKR